MTSQPKSLVVIFSLLILIGLPAFSFAQKVMVPVAKQGESLGEVNLPSKGQKQDQVRQQYGQPLAMKPARGNPPIARWDYQNFSVYFEGDVVIHSVKKHRPYLQAQE